MTLATWLVAFATVTAILSIFGHQLAELPLAIRALMISGVLVVVMTQLVQPALNSIRTPRRTRPGS